MCKIYCLICDNRIKKIFPTSLIKHWLWRYFPLGRKARDFFARHWNFSIFFVCNECYEYLNEMEKEDE